jgi:hypothetical protein
MPELEVHTYQAIPKRSAAAADAAATPTTTAPGRAAAALLAPLLHVALMRFLSLLLLMYVLRWQAMYCSVGNPGGEHPTLMLLEL